MERTGEIVAKELALGLHLHCIRVHVRTPSKSLSHLVTTSLSAQQMAVPHRQSHRSLQMPGAWGNYYAVMSPGTSW